MDKEDTCCSSPKCQLLFISIAFFFVFTGFNGGQNLESSLDLGKVSGACAVGINYVTFTLTCLVAPWITKLLSPKYTILAQFIAVALFCLANIWPRFWLYPSAALLGLSSAPLWVAQGEFVSTLAERQWMLKNEDVFGYFNGIFYGFAQLTQISGNLISAMVLGSGSKGGAPTFAPTCSPEYSMWFHESKDEAIVSEKAKYVLFVGYAGSCGIGFFIFLIWVNRLKYNDLQRESTLQVNRLKYNDLQRKSTSQASKTPAKSTFESIGQKIGTNPDIYATFRLMARPEMFLLIPAFIGQGLEMGFSFGALTRDVITVNLGKENIGYCMVAYGSGNTISSLVFGKVSDIVGQVACMIFGVLSLNGVIAELYWKVEDLQYPSWTYILVVTGAWGLCDGIYQTTISALLGKKFEQDKDAAFANWRMWQSLGAALMFFCQESLELNTKLFIVSVSLWTAIVGLLISKIIELKK